MAEKRTTYVEPASYFNSAMKKADREWEKDQRTKQKVKKQSTGRKK